MPIEQKYNRIRKRSKIGSKKIVMSKDKSEKARSIHDNPIITWLKKDWQIIAGLIIIFCFSLFLRAYFYYPIATEDGFLLSGNDPFYHKRVIDFAQQYHYHLKFDPLLDYPLVGANPRPPVYDWSNAITGLFISPLFNGDTDTATWYVFLFSPALWGALTIFPVYFLTRDMFGRKPAMIAAFFMSIMASHVERSPLGFSDHDAMVVFFVVCTIFFLAKAVGHLKDKYWVVSWKNPVDITNGIKDFFIQNPVSISYSILCGLSIATVALIWKGFPYVMVIVLISFLVLAVVNHIRKTDSLGIFVCMYLAFAVGLGISLPWYALFNIGTWMEPLYLMIAFLIIGLAFVPTRDLPWIIVIPGFVIIIGSVLAILSYFQPTLVDTLFTGGGYFIKSKLYSTIAEAQAPDSSRLAISYGPVTFYLTLIGLILAAMQIPKHWKMDFFIIIVWCTLAIYMAMSAVRFMFNATPVFAILSGWVTWNIIESLDPTLRVFKKLEIRFVYLYIGILTLLVLTLSYWWLYLEEGNYAFFQTVLALALLGIFIAIFTAWIMLRYNFYVGILIYVSYIVLWVWYSFDILIDITFNGATIVWSKLPWEQFYFNLMLIALVFVPIIIFLSYKSKYTSLKLDLRHVSIALFLVFLVFTPNIMFGIDAGIPYEKKSDLDPAGKTFGAFGHSFPSEYWQAGMDWLSEQDNELLVEERPAFISWWDYGFWCLYLGEHPTVADNFQAGYQLAGSFIGATNETQAISLFATRILEGDFKEKPRYEFSPEVKEIIIKHLDSGNQTEHPHYDKLVKLYKIELKTTSESDQNALVKEVRSHPEKYGNFDDLQLKNAKYAAIRHMLESLGKERVVDLLHDIEVETGKSIRYFAVDTRLFPFSAQNTGIFYAPMKLADKDIADYLKYYAKVEVRDNTEDDWRLYSDTPIPTEKLPDEIDLFDLVDTHGGNNVRIKNYQIKYTDDFYNSMFYKCYIGYSYKDLFPEQPNDELQVVPQLFGSLSNSQPMQGWNMTHFRLVYRTGYWTPHNETELKQITGNDKGWVAMNEIDAIRKIQIIEDDGKDNDKNGEVDDRGEGGTWSVSYPTGGVYFLKYYDGAIVKGQVLTDSESQIPLSGIRVTVRDDYGIPHDTVFTDEFGNYNLTVPFGYVEIKASKDGFPENEEESLGYRMQLSEQTELNRSYLEITDAQAMRRTSNYIITEDIKIPVNSVSGRLYLELTNDDNYNPGEDKIPEKTTLYLNSTIKKYNLNYKLDIVNDPDSDGTFEFAEVVPGEYQLFALINGHMIESPNAIVFTRNEETGVMQDVESDFAIKPAVLLGNATYTNDTGYLPKNVTIKLHDLTNGTVMNFDLENSKAYSFSELLPGKYILSVSEPKIRYFEKNITLETNENQTIEIDLMPLVPVKGIVYNDLNKNGIDANDIVPNAHVELFNNDRTAFSTVLVADGLGVFGGNITIGNYSVYIHYSENFKDYVHVSNLNVKNISQVDLTLELEDGFWINGTVTRRIAHPESHVNLKFIFTDDDDGDDDKGSEIALYTPTNSEGQYRVFIPYRKYRIEVLYVSTENTTYLYHNTSSLLMEDVEDIIKNSGSEPFEGGDTNGNSARSRDSSDLPRITKDIYIHEASILNGYVYWDHNGDGNFSLENESGSSYVGESSPEFINSQLTYYPYDLSGPENELVVGTKFKFVHKNITIYATTDKNGYYLVYLPPGNNSIELDDPRFKTLETTNTEDKLYADMPLDRAYAPILSSLVRDFSLVPVNTTISGHTWYDRNRSGIFDINTTIPNVPIEFTLLAPMPMNMNANTTNTASFNKTIISDANGAYNIELMPGEYSINIYYESNSIATYGYDQLFSVPFNNPQIQVEENIGLIKTLFVNISFDTDDSPLNISDLKNVELEIYSENGEQINQSFFKLNGTYFQGHFSPMEITLVAKFTKPSSTIDGDSTNYIFIGLINFTETNSEFKITLRKSTQFSLKGYVDKDASGNFTTNEERPDGLNVTILESTGGSLRVYIVNGILNMELMPGRNYTILINDTLQKTSQEIAGFRTIRYISEYNFEIGLEEYELDLDIPLIKYFKLSGKIFYDQNENQLGDDEELDVNVPIHFTGPMDFTLISNASGRFSKFVLPGIYSVTIENEKFLEIPITDTFNVSYETTFFDIFEDPKKVRVFGFTYFDSNKNYSYESISDVTQGDVQIEILKKVFTEPFAGVDDQSDLDTEIDKTIRVVTDPASGKFEVYLAPGEYTVHAYKPLSNTQFAYCNLDQFFIEHIEQYEYNISVYDGRLVEGNVFYRDSELNEIHDLDSRYTGSGLQFENENTGGTKLVQYFDDGFIGEFYLPYGNYSVTTEYLSEEHEMEMEYLFSETIEIKPDVKWYTFELNKEPDFTFELTVEGDGEVERRTANLHENVFTVKVQNKGNTYNVIQLKPENVPPGWYVHLSNSTIPLDISGKYSTVQVTVDITIPVGGYARNEITLRGEPVGIPDPSSMAKTVSLNVLTPPAYGFEVDYDSELNRGIGINDTLLFNITITNLGNADDEIYIKLSNIPDDWNVTIPAAWEAGDGGDGTESEIKYSHDLETFVQQINQIDETRTVTVSVASPVEENVTFGETARILIGIFSKNKASLEDTQEFRVTIREPDIIVNNIKFQNADLISGTDVIIQAVLENRYLYTEEVNLSLYINDVLIQNKTIYDLAENGIVTVDFDWNVSNYDLTDHHGREFRFRIEANSEQTFDELDYQNNKFNKRQLIGEEPEAKEYNWRPIYAMMSLLIILLIVYGVYRWRKKF